MFEVWVHFNNWVEVMDVLKVPWYSNNHEPQGKTHFKWHKYDDETFMVVWRNDDAEPTNEQIEAKIKEQWED